MAEAAVPTVVATPILDRVRPNARLIGLLALGHFVVDATQGSIPAVLPFLKNTHNLSYGAVGTLVLAANLTSSIVQPVFGYLSDQSARRWLLPLGILLSGLAFALMGLAPAYWMLLPLILAMGLGVAAFHPEAYKAATSVAGHRKATALSWFTLGGNVGIAVGPPVVTMLLATYGPGGLLGMAVPSVLTCAFLLAVLSRLSPEPPAARAGSAVREGQDLPGAMAILIAVVAVRSWASLGFSTFVPLYYVDHLKADPRMVGLLLFVFLGCGALGTVLAGPIADRFGPRPFMQWALLAASPLALLFVWMSDGGFVSLVLLGALGAVLTSSFSVSVVLGQSYLPRHAGMASGLTVGFAIGAAGLGVGLLGRVADAHGLPIVLWISALMPLLGFVVSRFLPEPVSRS